MERKASNSTLVRGWELGRAECVNMEMSQDPGCSMLGILETLLLWGLLSLVTFCWSDRLVTEFIVECKVYVILGLSENLGFTDLAWTLSMVWMKQAKQMN